MQCVRQHRNFSFGKVTDRLHIGNRWMSLGMNTYDNTARFHYPLIPSFDTPDPCLDKYPDLSPYSHCAGNPLRYVDPSGKEYGDTLGTRDDAARDFGECYNGISIIENAEYVTNIYTFSIDNGRRVCRNARCTFFLFIIIQTCSFSLSCDLLKISLIYVFPVSKNSSYKLIKQSNQPVHTFFCQFCTHLFYIEGNG